MRNAGGLIASSNCADAGNTIITIVAGPLSYVGVNPKVTCAVPQPTAIPYAVSNVDVLVAMRTEAQSIGGRRP